MKGAAELQEISQLMLIHIWKAHSQNRSAISQFSQKHRCRAYFIIGLEPQGSSSHCLCDFFRYWCQWIKWNRKTMSFGISMAWQEAIQITLSIAIFAVECQLLLENGNLREIMCMLCGFSKQTVKRNVNIQHYCKIKSWCSTLQSPQLEKSLKTYNWLKQFKENASYLLVFYMCEITLTVPWNWCKPK